MVNEHSNRRFNTKFVVEDVANLLDGLKLLHNHFIINSFKHRSLNHQIIIGLQQQENQIHNWMA
jgi:hypothetical protein